MKIEIDGSIAYLGRKRYKGGKIVRVLVVRELTPRNPDKPNDLQMFAYDKTCTMLDGFEIGESVKVHADLHSRLQDPESKRYQNSLVAFRVFHKFRLAGN